MRVLLTLASVAALVADRPADPSSSRTANSPAIAAALANVSERVPLRAFGAVCDGNRHPLSERFASLAAAQAVYPAATSLNDEIDSTALVSWLAYLDGTTTHGRKTARPGWIGQGTCMVDRTLYLPLGVDIQGAGRSQTTARGGADLQRVPGMAGDMFRVIPYTDQSNRVRWWEGKLSGFRIMNTDATATSGNGINFVDASGNPVRAQNNTVFEDLIVRGMPENGIRLPIGGIGTYFSRTEFFQNKLSGVYWSGRADAVLFSGVSGDANGEAIMNFVNVEADSGTVLIQAVKSEENDNRTFSIHGRNTPLLIQNDGESASFIVNGISHIRADRDASGGTLTPGSAIVFKGRQKPDILFQGVKIRVRPKDTGPEPYSFEGRDLSPPVLIPVRQTHGSAE